MKIKSKKVFSLQDKLKIIQELESGEKVAVVSKRHEVNESSIRRIKQNAEKIKNSVIHSTKLSSKVTTKSRDVLVEKSEKMLSIWIEDQNQKRMPLSSDIIRNKALQIYGRLKQDQPGSTTDKEFKASKGWFERFKARQNLRSLKLTGEAASADKEAAALFPETLRTIINTNRYLPNQIFNADETGLFWKRMPNRTFISKEEKVVPGFKAAKDRLTLLFCGNATGDFKCKPLLLYHSENPRAFKGINKSTLPVHWKSNKKAWMTSKLFEEWFTKYFCPEAEKYCNNKNIAFKILLLIDNAPSHPSHLSDLNPNVNVVFLPPNTTSLIQPMDQGVISLFKLHYLKRTLNQLVEATDETGGTSIRDYWKNYNIYEAVMNIKIAWHNVSDRAMQSAWKKLIINSSEGHSDTEDEDHGPSTEITEILRIGNNIGGEGFDDLNEVDVLEIVNAHNDEISIEDLLHQIQEETASKDSLEDLESQTEVELDKMTTQRLNKFIKMGNDFRQEALDIDPDAERSLKFSRSIITAMAPYKEILKMKQQAAKQTTITNFFSKSTADIEPDLNSSDSVMELD